MHYTRLKELRVNKCLTQQQVANMLFINRSTYQSYESGKRSIPISKIIMISEFYNVSMDYIAGRTNIYTPYKK